MEKETEIIEVGFLPRLAKPVAKAKSKAKKTKKPEKKRQPRRSDSDVSGSESDSGSEIEERELVFGKILKMKKVGRFARVYHPLANKVIELQEFPELRADIPDYSPTKRDVFKRPVKENILKLKKFQPTLKDIYVSEIPDGLRKYVIETYKSILGNITVEEKKIVPDVVFGAQIKQVVPWEEYYASNFRRWRFSKYQPMIVEKINVCTKEAGDLAIEEAEFYHGINSIIKNVFSLVPGGVNLNTSAKDVLQGIDSKEKPELYEVMIKTEILKIVDRDSVKGRNLAVLLSNQIEKYMQRYPPNPDIFFAKIMDSAVQQKFQELEIKRGQTGLEEDRKEFDEKFLQALIQSHAEAVAQQEKDRKNAEKAGVFEKEVVETRPSRVVEEFEEKVYSMLPYKNVMEYMTLALIPYMFLRGPLSYYSLHFKNKILSGDINFSSLSGLSLFDPSFFPELFMNTKILEKDMKRIKELMIDLLIYELDSSLSLYFDISFKITSTNLEMELRNVFSKYLLDAVKTCGVLTNSKIDEKNLVINFDKETRNFQCLDSAVLRKNFSQGDFKNPYTGKNFDEDFIERFEKLFPEEKRIKREIKEVEKVSEKIKTFPETIQKPVEEPRIAPELQPVVESIAPEPIEEMKELRISDVNQTKDVTFFEYKDEDILELVRLLGDDLEEVKSSENIGIFMEKRSLGRKELVDYLKENNVKFDSPLLPLITDIAIVLSDPAKGRFIFVPEFDVENFSMKTMFESLSISLENYGRGEKIKNIESVEFVRPVYAYEDIAKGTINKRVTITIYFEQY